MTRKLRDDLVDAGIEPKAAVVLASVIPDISAIDELRADLRGPFDALHREFARVRNLAIAAAGLTIAVTALLGALALGAGG